MRRMYSLNQLQQIANERVEALVEGGTLENAKPIYYHPINCYNNTRGCLSFLILDNNPTAYTKETCIAKLKTFSRVSPITGAIENNSKTLIVAYAFTSGEDKYLMGMYTNGEVETGSGVVSLFTYINGEDTNFVDGVNKVN